MVQIIDDVNGYPSRTFSFLTRTRARPQHPTPVSDSSPEPGFDEIVGKLREVVNRLEQGNLSLEESLRAYEEGIALARRGHDVLDRAEKRVEVLVRGEDGRTRQIAVDGSASEPAVEPVQR